MTVSPARAGYALLLAGALAAGGALAQSDDGQPLSLIPFEDGASTGTSTLEPVPEPSVVPSAEGLEIETLAPVDAAAVGTLTMDSGGFTVDLWRDADPGLTAELLGRLVEVDGSPTAADLARRLLLTAAPPPEGFQGDLLALRIDGLNAFGLAGEVPALVASAGRGALSAAALASLADSDFLNGDFGAACRDVLEGLAVGNDDRLQQALVFCQRLAGDDAAADLGLTVLQDSGAALAPEFVSLDQSLAARRPGSLETLAGATPLVFAMAIAAEVPLDEAIVATAPPAIQRAIADRADLDGALRLAAAELATAAGAMPGTALAAAYDAAPYDDAAIANALSRAENLEGAAARALLFRASRNQTLPAARAEALAALLHHAAETGGPDVFLAVARAAADTIATLQPASELAWFSADASVALLLAGKPEAAARWWPLLQDRALADQDFQARATALWPIFRIAFGERLPDDGSGMADWWAATEGVPEERRMALAGTYLAAFAALGDAAGGPLLGQLVSVAAPADWAPPSPAMLFALEGAAGNGHVGETVLLALSALGAEGPAAADPTTLAAVIRALEDAGLTMEGRLVAMEASGQRAIARP